jgi:5-(carboxyamino)imidazole ribonucleotide synthase
VVGIIGGGQLARMMYQASLGLGIEVRLLAEGPEVSAAAAVHDVTVGDYTDPATVRAFAQGCDAVTFDHEHVPGGLLRDLEAAGVAVRPGPEACPGQGGDAPAAERARYPVPGIPGRAGRRGPHRVR